MSERAMSESDGRQRGLMSERDAAREGLAPHSLRPFRKWPYSLPSEVSKEKASDHESNDTRPGMLTGRAEGRAEGRDEKEGREECGVMG